VRGRGAQWPKLACGADGSSVPSQTMPSATSTARELLPLAKFGIVCDGTLLPSAPQASFGHCAAGDPRTRRQARQPRQVRPLLSPTPTSRAALKLDPKNVILAAITAPKDPVSTMAVSGTSLCGGASTCTNIAHS